uniref:Uncharacterized protein n=1 Tax=Ditylenchus dipsaci TaxID=166011 RepID=A0A915DKU2_9BILA
MVLSSLQFTLHFSCFRNALLINLCDPFEKWGKPLVIEISILLSFLHSSNRKSQLLMIAYCSLNVGIEELWDMLAEVQCPKKIVKPKEREMRNLKTSEVLWMRTDMPNILAVGPAVNDSSSGFVLVFVV